MFIAKKQLLSRFFFVNYQQTLVARLHGVAKYL